MMRAISSVVVLAVLVVAAGQVRAGMIVSPTSVVANTLGDFDEFRDIGNTIDQSGLSLGFTSGVTDFDTYIGWSPTHAYDSSNPPNNAWFGASGNNTGHVDFDLGQQLNVLQLALWNDDYHGASSITISTSNDSAFGTSANVGTFTPYEHGNPNHDPLPAQVFDLTDSAARFVRIQINATYGHELTGWGEVAFDTSAVPEPTTALLLACGLAGLAAAGRRRSSQ